MSKDRENRSNFFKSFSVLFVIISILIICAAFISIMIPITLYIDIFIILALCIIAILMCIKELKDKKYKLGEISKNVDSIFKETLDLIDIPMAIVSMQGDIIWKNNVSEHLLPDEYIEKVALKLESLKKKSPTSSVIEELGSGECLEIREEKDC